MDRIVDLGTRPGSLGACYHRLCRRELIVSFSCQVSGAVWFVVALQRPGAGFAPDLVLVFVQSMG